MKRARCFADVQYIMDIMDIFKHKRVLLTLLLVFTSFCIFAQSPSETRSKFVNYSKQFIGTKYQRGATGPDAFDCSGFVYSMSRESVGVQLPRTSQAMYTFAVLVPESDCEAGDLVFFRTTSSGNISHVGILIDENTFIHCASDGPKTGVITSSLASGYWKEHFVGFGRVLPTSKKKQITVNPLPRDDKTVVASSEPSETKSASSPAKMSSSTSKVEPKKTSATTKPKSRSSANGDFVADFSLCMDWSVLTAKDFILNFRGVSTSANLRYAAWSLEPGLGVMFRYDNKMGIIQLPIVLSLTFSDYLRAYAGPVVTFGDADVPGIDHDAEGSIFPGIMGLSLSTPSWDLGAVKIALIQDIQYTVFNEKDGSALSARNSTASGLLLSTGVRLSLPL